MILDAGIDIVERVFGVETRSESQPQTTMVMAARPITRPSQIRRGRCSRLVDVIISIESLVNGEDNVGDDRKEQGEG